MTTYPNWSAAQLDWIRLWQEMHDAERLQGDSVTHPDMNIGNDYYASAADRFVRYVNEIPQPDRFITWLLPALEPGDTVLDIGAGSGRYIPALINAGCRVLALEPSAAMRSHLERTVSQFKPEQVSIIPDAWPASTPTHCDISIAIQVIDAIRDIHTFIDAMHRSTHKRCVILMAVRHPSTPIHSLWQAYYQMPRKLMPGLYECINVLAQMGITANVHMFPGLIRLSFQRSTMPSTRRAFDYDSRAIAIIEKSSRSSLRNIGNRFPMVVS